MRRLLRLLVAPYVRLRVDRFPETTTAYVDLVLIEERVRKEHRIPVQMGRLA